MMPKKVVGKQSKKSVQKAVSPKNVPAKKSATGRSSQPLRKAVVKGKAVTKSRNDKKPLPPKAVPIVKPASPVEENSLGRPLVTQEEKLYMLFHDDYQARQVFEFLRVETVKELETFSQQQIVHMMSKPLRMTVDRIRQRLAQFKRSLKDDEQFAADFLKNNE